MSCFETLRCRPYYQRRYGRPLREVVSWKIHQIFLQSLYYRRPLREVVSWKVNIDKAAKSNFLSTSAWGRELKDTSQYVKCCFSGRPLREVVSWKNHADVTTETPSSSTSAWGRELKGFIHSDWQIWNMSTSAWGRELKGIFYSGIIITACRRPLREVVSWKMMYHGQREELFVDLCVRSWVERRRWLLWLSGRWSTSAWGRELKDLTAGIHILIVKSTSAWGRELKDTNGQPNYFHNRRPLREVVSWNSLLYLNILSEICRPLREVVSWKNVSAQHYLDVLRSTSAWGRELKEMKKL